VCRAGWGKKASGDEAAAASSSSTADNTPSELPFQLQVTYTDLDGARAMRVLTQVQPVTRDRSEAETRTCTRLNAQLHLLHFA